MTQSAGNPQPLSSPSPLICGGSGPNVPLPPAIGKAIVAPSGRSVVLLAEDGTGALTGVTGINPAGEVQSVSLSAMPAGSGFSLSFGGRSTAPIPVAGTPPPVYALFTFPTVAGHSYDLAFAHPYCFVPALACEVIQGGLVVAGRTTNGEVHLYDLSQPGSFVDGKSVIGNPLGWATIATGLVATGSSLSIRVSGVGYIWVDAVRVADDTAGTVQRYLNTDATTCTLVPAAAWGTINDPSASLSPTVAAASVTGSGETYAVVGGASALQSALQALATIGPGGVTVVDQTPAGGSGAYQVGFVGPLANSPQAVLGCADPAVAVAEVVKGGNSPTISINGGPPILLTDWAWSEPSPLPYAIAPLPQSAPASQVYPGLALPCQQNTGWNCTFINDASVTGQVIAGYSAGLTMQYPFQELPAGTYQIGVTFPNAPVTQYGTTYQPSSATQFLVLDGTGATLATVAVDQTKAPSDLTSGGHGYALIGTFTLKARGSLTLVINTVGLPARSGSTQPVAIFDAALLVRTSADASIVIGPTDQVSVSIPSGWMTTQAGAIPAQAMAASPPSPNAILPPFVAGPKTMKAGYNVEPAGYPSTFVTHSNLAYLMDPMGIAQDANGYPTRISGSDSWNNQVLSGGYYLAGGDLVQGAAVINPGLFSMSWVGDPTIELTTASGFTTVQDLTANHPKPVNVSGNWKVYSIQNDPAAQASPQFRLHIHSTAPDPADPTGQTYITNLTGLAIYPPDPSDPTGNTIWGLNVATNVFTPPPTFHPWFLQKLQGMQCLRFLDPLQTNNNPAAALAHYKTTAHANRSGPTVASKTVGVASIKAPSGGNYFLPTSSTTIVQVTTTAPHGLFDGCSINFSGCGTAQFAGGSLNLDSNTDGVFGMVHVLDPTNLVVSCTGGNGSAMTNALSGGSIIANHFGPSWPLQDVVDLIAAVGCSDLWFNMPATVDVTPNGGAYQIASFLASALKPGVKVHLEFGNECWNYFTLAYVWCYLQNDRISGVHDGSYEVFYANQTKATHDQCLAAFTAAGRPGDLIRVYGAVGGQPSYSDVILAQATKLGAVVDELCVAVYFSCWPEAGYSADQLPIFHAMTPDQLLDYTELNAVYGQYPANLIANQVPVLQAHGYGSAKLVAYEGGLTTGVPIDPPNAQPPGNTPNFYPRQMAVRRHPRMYGIVLQHAQANQDAGLTLWNYFNVGDGPGPFCWDAYESGNQARGTGDPVADAINLTNYRSRNLVLSEVGGAWNRWASLVPSAASPAPPKGKPTPPPRRNGVAPAKGLKGGMARLIRVR